MVFFMLLACSVYCEVKQNIDTLLHPNILNDNMFAQNEIINDKIPNTQSSIKDTVSQKPLLKRPKICFYVALDTVVLPGIRVGCGWIDYDSTLTKENTITIHTNSLLFVSTVGIFCTVNNFTTPQRIGFFTSYSIGADYCVITGGDPGGPSHTDEYLFPCFTFGVGYSIKAVETSFLRISGDIGLKLIGVSITLSYVF